MQKKQKQIAQIFRTRNIYQNKPTRNGRECEAAAAAKRFLGRRQRGRGRQLRRLGAGGHRHDEQGGVVRQVDRPSGRARAL